MPEVNCFADTVRCYTDMTQLISQVKHRTLKLIYFFRGIFSTNYFFPPSSATNYFLSDVQNRLFFSKKSQPPPDYQMVAPLVY